ncbi:hypothetical protein R1CP_33525 [Rhodococcus opacus]|uniref:Integrase catalytic domain-containing protein n=1 Tax=Rhodococcus opacus TaxID=37919 RepID=A0A1B1KFE3_RHOOP|nr:hypothetical protein R1CP_33525 [Rhodococcus opacus]
MIHTEDNTYGAPRITAELNDGVAADDKVNHKRVARVMRENDIVGYRRRRRVTTTVPEPADRKVPDLLNRDFTADAPNRAYVGDVTYLPIEGGTNLYLATVIDCYSRKLAGWAIADHMRTDLVADALRAAAQDRNGLAGAVFHSDHGSQYTSKEFAALCDRLGVTQSMGVVGTSADNSLAESFNAALKREVLQNANTWPDEATCRRQVFRAFPPRCGHQFLCSGGQRSRSLLELDRTDLTEGGMPPSGVVARDPTEDFGASLTRTVPALPTLQRLPLQRRVQRLGSRVVRRRPDRTPRPGHPQLATQVGEIRRRILRSVVGVDNRSLETVGAATECRCPQRIGNQLGTHVIGDRPPRQPPRTQVQHRRQLQKGTITDRQIGGGTSLHAVLGGMSPTYRVFGALAVKSRRIRSFRRGRVRIGDGGAHRFAQVHPDDPVLTHHPFDPLVIDLDPGIAQLGGHPRGPVGAIGVGVDGADPRSQLLVGAGTGGPGRRRGPPPVEA